MKNFNRVLIFVILWGNLIAKGEIIIGDSALVPTPTPDLQTKPVKFLALGDSYTIGQGVAAADRWPDQLVNLLRCDEINVDDPEIIARTGWSTGQLLRAIEIANPDKDYDLVTLMIGVNNQYRNLGLVNFMIELDKLIQKAIQFASGMNEQVMLISIPDWGASPFAASQDGSSIACNINAFNQVIVELARKYNITFVDVTDISRGVYGIGRYYAPDGLHPSGLQYRLWTDRIFPVALGKLSNVSAEEPAKVKTHLSCNQTGSLRYR